MAKRRSTKRTKESDTISDLAASLLRAMAASPARIEYNTRVLGGTFKDADIARLDRAYAELADRGLIERASSVVSFFGAPKPLYRITDEGEARVGDAA